MNPPVFKELAGAARTEHESITMLYLIIVDVVENAMFADMMCMKLCYFVWSFF